MLRLSLDGKVKILLGRLLFLLSCDSHERERLLFHLIRDSVPSFIWFMSLSLTSLTKRTEIEGVKRLKLLPFEKTDMIKISHMIKISKLPLVLPKATYIAGAPLIPRMTHD
jgi:hypothetical protein